MGRRSHRRGCAWAAVVGVSVLGGLYILYALRPPSRLDFLLHHGRYEALVAEIKSRQPTREADERYPAKGFVRVSYARDRSGNYEVTITMDDEGHFGYLGYIYSDRGTPDRIFPTWPIAPHWWGFHDNTW